MPENIAASRQRSPERMRTNGRASHGRDVSFVASSAVIAVVLHFLRFGYAYASGDQDETLPLVLRRLYPSLYGGDWFVNLESAEIGVRSAYVGLIAVMADVIPLWLVVLLLHVATIMIVAAAVHRLTYLLVGSDAAAMTAAVVAVVLTPQWTLGGNDLVHGMLVPSTIAWSFGLWAIVAHLCRRPLVTGALLGAAALFQALVGLQLAALLFAGIAFVPGTPVRDRLRSLAFSAGPFALIAAPILIPTILAQQAPAEGSDVVYPSLLYILAEFRAPHHYLPGSFPFGTVLRFLALLTAGVGSLLWLRKRSVLRHGDFLFVGLYVLATFLVLGYLFTETLPLLPVIKLQPFKLTVAAKPILVAAVAGAFFRLTPWGRVLEHFLRTRARVVVTLLMLVAVVAALITGASDSAIRAKVHSLSHARTGLGLVEEWAQHATDQGATFLIPPSNTTFRIRARRSVVVNFKSVPFEPDRMRRWFQRLLATAPIELPDRTDRSILRTLDEAYTSQSPTRFVSLTAQYGATHVLIEREIDAPDVLREVFHAGTWHVYQPVEFAGPSLTRSSAPVGHVDD